MAKPGQQLVGGSRNDEISTPDDLYADLDRVFQFNYDPAASYLNHRCSFYSTKDGTFDAARAHLKVSDLSGLEYPWAGHRVFINPPYSYPLFRDFVDKMIEESLSAELIVGLVKWDTSTVNCKRLAQHASVIPLKRVKYKGKDAHATFASAIVLMNRSWGGYAR